MTYTSHGHHIEGTIRGEDRPPVARCGGPGLCPECSKEAARIIGEISKHQPAPKVLTNENRVRTIKGIVRNYVDLQFELGEVEDRPAYSVLLVWFSKTLENWKALAITTLGDQRYFEITHNGRDEETYLDVYQKVHALVIGPHGDRQS